MLNKIFNKIKFLWKKPKVIIVTGQGRTCAREVIFQVLKHYFKINKDILVFETDLENAEEFKFLVSKSSLPILVAGHIEDKEKTSQIGELAKVMPPKGYLILNFDDETIREIKNCNSFTHIITFGFQEGADFQATDINLNAGVNFKVNYKGNIVPIWLEGLFGKEQIYSVLSAICVGVIFDLNLVEISQALKDYQGLPGN